MAKRKNKVSAFKKQAGEILNILVTEHAKLTIIIGITLLACLFLYVYKHPVSVPTRATPIELLPRVLGTWRGEDVFLAVPMKNNRYCSVLFTDPRGHKIRFISYQRQNEKNEQLHYPEDCLRANGYVEDTQSLLPLVAGTREVFFKKITATHGAQSICHYYVVFSGDGEAVTYGKHRQDFGVAHFQQLLERRLQLHRNHDQLFLFTLTTTGGFSADTDAQVQELLSAMPAAFFPGQQ